MGYILLRRGCHVSSVHVAENVDSHHTCTWMLKHFVQGKMVHCPPYAALFGMHCYIRYFILFFNRWLLFTIHESQRSSRRLLCCVFAKVGGPQICSATRKSAHLPQMWHFADLGLSDPIFSVICELKTSASPQIHTFAPFKYSILYNTAII
jgi:hypothetical protein